MQVGTILVQYWTMSRSSVGVKTPMDNSVLAPTSNTNTPTTINSLGSEEKQSRLLRRSIQSVLFSMMEQIKCWGDDSQGQLGNGAYDDLSSPPSSAINFLLGELPKQITGGEYHFCAILDDDSIKCWGDGTNEGQLGTMAPSVIKTHPLRQVVRSVRVGMRW